MAITITNLQQKQGFAVNATSADASGTEVLVSGVAGKKTKVRQVLFNNLTVAAISFTLGQGETGGAVTEALLGPVSVGANSTFQLSFNPLIELDDAEDLTLDVSGAGAVCCFAQGVIE